MNGGFKEERREVVKEDFGFIVCAIGWTVVYLLMKYILEILGGWVRK